MQLVINAGSSTLKWAVFSDARSDRKLLSGSFERFGEECAFSFSHRTETLRIPDHGAAVRYLLEFLSHNRVTQEPMDSCVHRVVHGGEKYHAPTIITDEVLDDIEELSILAPLHNPANAAGIRACREQLPGSPQVAIFDTAFHHSIAREVFLYGIPYALYEKHRIRRYGFHGISHSYIASALREHLGAPVDAISCHLGSGSSITAIKDGRSADTTMGFTPLDGVLMATRSGDLDPEIPLFLLREEHYSLDELDELLSHRSGLLGVTGHKDMRDIWRLAQEGDDRARLGLDMLAYRVAYYVNAMRTAVPRPRALVFTAGIGERAWYVRKAVCNLLGIPLDNDANARDAERIDADGADLQVYVIPTDEQLQMHRLAQAVL